MALPGPPARSEELTKGREGRGLAGDLGASPAPVSSREGLWDTGHGVLLKKSHSYLIPFPHPIKPHAIWLSLSYLRQVSHHLCPSVLETGLSHGLVWSADRNEELKHLLEFLRIRAMMMLTIGLLGLCLLQSLQSGIYCVWNIPQPSLLLQHHGLCDSGVMGPPFCLSTRAGLLLPRYLEVFRRISFSKP